MTKTDELMALADKCYFGTSVPSQLRTAIATALDEARADERESAVQTCVIHANKVMPDNPVYLALVNCAAAIRKGPTP